MHFVCIFYFIFLSLSAWADEPSLLSNSVSLALSGDNAGGRSSSLSVELTATEKLRWHIGGGISSVKNEASTNPKKTAQNFWTGVDYRLTEYFEAGAQISSWGLQDELQHRVFYIPLSVKYQSLDFLLRPGAGEVEFATNTQRTQEFLFKDQSVLITVGYTFIEYLRVGLTHEAHNYESNRGVKFSNLSADVASIFFSEATLSLAASILKQRDGIEISYAFEKFDLGVSGGRIESAFDGSIARYSEIFASFSIEKNWLLGASIGETRSEELIKPMRYLELMGTYNF